VPGTLDETDGRVTFRDAGGADSYDVIDEIACRALLTGARVVSAPARPATGRRSSRRSCGIRSERGRAQPTSATPRTTISASSDRPRDWPLPQDHVGPLQKVSKKAGWSCAAAARCGRRRCARCGGSGPAPPGRGSPAPCAGSMGQRRGLQAQESRANLLVSSLSNRLCLTK
jgi:hypothetical protein